MLFCKDVKVRLLTERKQFIMELCVIIPILINTLFSELTLENIYTFKIIQHDFVRARRKKEKKNSYIISG